MKVRDITGIAFMLAIIIVLGFVPAIPLGFIPLPIVVQNLGIMLSGLLLGKKKGAVTVVLFLFLVALGLPLLPGGRGGMSVFFGPSVGYLFSYPLAAFAIGWAKETWLQANCRPYKVLITLIIFGVVLVDAMGMVGMSIQMNISLVKSVVSNLAFLPGDLLKALLATCVYLALPQKITNRLSTTTLS